jgi:hypothetical protein
MINFYYIYTKILKIMKASAIELENMYKLLLIS